MSDELRCSTDGCEERPEYRYTWPGQPEDVCCPGCAQKLANVSAALGCPVQFIHLSLGVPCAEGKRI